MRNPSYSPAQLARILTSLVLSAALALCALAADQDFFVSSSGNDAVKRFDGVTGQYLGNFFPPGTGGLSGPQEVLFLEDGDMIVTGIRNSSILRYDGQTGAFKGNFTSGFLLSSPTKTTFGPDGLLYVSQWNGSEKIIRFDGLTGAFVDVFTSHAVPNGMGHAWDAAGNLYVAAYRTGGDGNVHQFGPDGTRLSFFIPATLGILRGPVNLWTEGQELIVLDWTNGAAERFRLSDGGYIGRKFSGLTRAEGYLFAPDGFLYICEWGANQVRRFTPGGGNLGPFLFGGNLLEPNSIAFGPPLQVVKTTKASFGELKATYGND